MQLVDWDPAASWRYARGLARAFAGAIVFSLPLLMTMEMWWLGFYLERTNLLQFILVNLAVLVGLSRLSGFEETATWFDDVLDAFSAYAVAVLASLMALTLFGILLAGMPASEIVGKVAIQSVPASFGAMLAGKQFGAREDEVARRDRRSYLGQLFLMLAGALFLGFSVAPTEEMLLISHRMTPAHSAVLVLLSIVLLHGFVYTVGFKGQEKPEGPTDFLHVFLRFSIAGYAIAVLASFYVLWTFGRVDGSSWPEVAWMVAVLGFPSAIGAALAPLVI